MHSVLEQRKQWQKQYISVGKTDLFYNSMGLSRNFTFKYAAFQNKSTPVMMILVDQISDGICFKTALPYSDANETSFS